MLKGRKVVIPTEIPATYVRKAEEIVSKSYDHSETFSSVCIVMKEIFIFAIILTSYKCICHVNTLLSVSAGPGNDKKCPNQ